MGLVYVIGPCEPCTPYRVKIGRTDGNAIHRKRDLQVGSPFRLEVLCTFQVTDAARLEDEIHAELAGYRVHGEWFELPGDPVATVKAAVAQIRAESGRREARPGPGQKKSPQTAREGRWGVPYLLGVQGMSQ